MDISKLSIKSGKPQPFGANLKNGVVNFAIFSRHATKVWLCLYEKHNTKPITKFLLDPMQNKTGDIWHISVGGLKAGALYAWKADGPFAPHNGFRFNPNKTLIDPYAKALAGSFNSHNDSMLAYNKKDLSLDLSFSTSDNSEYIPKCVIIDDSDFDWEGDKPLNLPLRDCIIYETHIKGLTADTSIYKYIKDFDKNHAGTYLGLIDIIPYLKSLGITSLELLPIQEFDSNENTRHNPENGNRLSQYWGYNTLAFFAPKGSYAASGYYGQQVTEFKTMVKALHKAGIEIILDVVFNHTGEGNELGPSISFRGLDNSIWYILDDNSRYYKNYSGCGNTLNCNHPVVRNFILDCLHYWVTDMHVDGFRFDLGSILGRDQKGNLLENPPVIEQIAEDPLLRQTKIIAEAWDAGGAYQVGSFPGGRWAEWNDRYRDDVRRYWRGDSNSASAFATRISGSSDLYLRDGRKPFHSINYITSHDGFTLRDLVSYNGKHNEPNGENGFDGHNSNFSFNYGHEGSTKDINIRTIRLQQQKNFLATLLLSVGTVMLLGGDEFSRTQKGNNNAYCQDNEISWYDWTLLDANNGLKLFLQKLIAFRLAHPAFRRPDFFTGQDKNNNTIPDISWYSPSGAEQNWTAEELAFAVMIDGNKADTMADKDDNTFYCMFNPENTDFSFYIPSPQPGCSWCRIIDTSLPSPLDFAENGTEQILDNGKPYLVKSKSLVLLVCHIRSL